MSKPFKILLVAVAVLLSVGLVRGTLLEMRGGSGKTQEGIDSIDAGLERLDNFKD
jgi:hypothetical protein